MSILIRVIPKPIRKLLKPIYLFFRNKLITYLGSKYNLIHLVQLEAEKKFFRYNSDKISKILGNEKISAYDIGARGGMESEWDKYSDLLDITLVEPDPEEAAKLKEKGYNVIPNLLGSYNGKCILNIGERGGTSSILEPTGAFLELYTSGNSRRFNVVDKVEISMTTIADIIKNNNGRIDYMKLDTQGTELEIIKGFGNVRPMFIKTEISFVPLYKDSAIFYDLGNELYKMGYILFHLTYYARSSPKKHISKKPYSSTLIPTHGDAWFCPDWTRPEGLKMIEGRKKQYKALMLLFGLEDVYNYAFPNNDLY